MYNGNARSLQAWDATIRGGGVNNDHGGNARRIEISITPSIFLFLVGRESPSLLPSLPTKPPNPRPPERRGRQKKIGRYCRYLGR